MADVTKESIAAIVELYESFVRDPSQGKLSMQLSKRIFAQLSKLEAGGRWEPDDTNYRKSFFEGITKLCWHFSTKNGADSAAAYTNFVKKNYNLWFNMSNKDQKTFGRECHEVTDGVDDWTAIYHDREDMAPLTAICQAAIEVTTGMYDQGSREVTSSERLWNDRCTP